MEEQASPPGEMGPDEGSTVLTVGEVSDAIAALTPTDKQKLRKAARFLCRFNGLPDHHDQELLQEALVRAIEGKRKCPRNLPVVPFLFGAIRSIASSYAKSISRSPIDPFASLPDDQEARPAADEQRDDADFVTPERQAVARDMLATIQSWFADDEDVQFLMYAMGEGLEGQALRDELGWTETKHNTVQRKMRRGIAKKLAESEGAP